MMVSYLVALFTGTMTAMQGGLNARLATALGNPVTVSMLSVLITAALLAIYCLITRVPIPSAAALASAPWWAWLGGLTGAIFLTLMIWCIQKLGAGAAISMFIAGQIATSLLIDHFALHGGQAHPINTGRLLGAILLVLGVWIIHKN